MTNYQNIQDLSNLDAIETEMLKNGFDKNYILQGLYKGIAQCEKIIKKESARSADLRPAYMQQAFDHAIAHKVKLEGQIAKIFA